MSLGVFCGVDKFAIKIDFIASNQDDIKKFDTFSICFHPSPFLCGQIKFPVDFLATLFFGGQEMWKKYEGKEVSEINSFKISQPVFVSRSGLNRVQQFYETVNVHLLIINAITYFVAPIVLPSPFALRSYLFY